MPARLAQLSKFRPAYPCQHLPSHTTRPLLAAAAAPSKRPPPEKLFQIRDSPELLPFSFLFITLHLPNL